MTDLSTDLSLPYDAVDLFSGPGGWDVAAHSLGIRVLGIEFDHAACETRRAAGLPTIEGDVRHYGPKDFQTIICSACRAPMGATTHCDNCGGDHTALVWTPKGFIASPPCQTFSAAGKGSGRKALDDVLLVLKACENRDDVTALLSNFEDERTGLVVEPLRWILEAIDAGIPYEWITLEQVPAVLPVWEAYAEILRREGYTVDVGKLSSEQYGVPQTRKRAILVAKYDQAVCGPCDAGLPMACAHPEPAQLPAPTHRPYKKGTPQDQGDPNLSPWVSMAEALQWGATARPSMTVTGGGTESGGGVEPFGNGARQSLKAEEDAGRWQAREVVGFPRISDDTPEHPREVIEIDGQAYRARDFRDVTEPAFGMTEKARSWTRVMIPNISYPNATVREEDEPSATITGGHDFGERRWALRPSVSDEGTQKSPPRPEDEPAHTVTGKHRSAEWVEERPATTVQGDPRIWPPGHKVNQADRDRIGTDEANERYGDRKGTGSVRVSTQEAAVLQSFPADYPWQGTRTKQFQQIGNAIPPLLARAILSEVTGRIPNPGIPVISEVAASIPFLWKSKAGGSPTTTSPTPPSADSTSQPGPSSSAPGSTSSTGSADDRYTDWCPVCATHGDCPCVVKYDGDPLPFG